jgi:hypothetical protein
MKDTNMGALKPPQKYDTFKEGVDYMTDEQKFQLVQNGKDTGDKLNMDASLYLHDGRG